MLFTFLRVSKSQLLTKTLAGRGRKDLSFADPRTRIYLVVIAHSEVYSGSVKSYTIGLSENLKTQDFILWISSYKFGACNQNCLFKYLQFYLSTVVSFSISLCIFLVLERVNCVIRSVWIRWFKRPVYFDFVDSLNDERTKTKLLGTA